MKREKYNVVAPTEKEVVRDYWELIAMEQYNEDCTKSGKMSATLTREQKQRKDYEDRLGYSNEYFYKDIVFSPDNKDKQMLQFLKLKRYGWKLYEVVDLNSQYNTVICRMMKVFSLGYQATLEDEMSVDVKVACEFIREPTPNNSLDHIEFTAKLHEGEVFSSKEERDDINLMDLVVRVAEKRVRDRIKGKKVYDAYELRGGERCSMGAYSFTHRHCTQPVYRDGVCYYHWMQMQDKRPGCNPALLDESLHATKRPYIPSVDEDAIFAVMKQYVEATRPITPAADTPKKPRCKHLLHEGQCSICLKGVSTSVDLSDLTDLPIGVDTAMKRNLERVG